MTHLPFRFRTCDLTVRIVRQSRRLREVHDATRLPLAGDLRPHHGFTFPATTPLHDRAEPGDRLTVQWQTAHSIGSSGPGQADDGRLKPGSYWFRVAAMKANGEPTGQEASLPIEVVLPMHLRLEFWLGLAALTGGGAAWLGRLALQRRMQRQIAQMEQEQALDRERARIARDLHDEIGAGLTEKSDTNSKSHSGKFKTGRAQQSRISWMDSTGCAGAGSP